MKVLSLGAGVQSTTVLLMSMEGDLPPLDAAIFADTGWEPKAVYKHLEWLESISTIPIHRVSAGNIKEDALQSKVRGLSENGVRWASMPFRTISPEGSIGMIRRQCTTEYKIAPIEKKLRELTGYKPYQRIPIGTVQNWFGITIDESRRVRQSKTRWIENHYPLVFDVPMSRGGCYVWLQKRGYDIPPRSACIGCPYRTNEEWRSLRDDSPDEFYEAICFDEAIRKCGGIRGDMYIHKDCVPLRMANIDEDHHDQELLWSGECEGMCGV